VNRIHVLQVPAGFVYSGASFYVWDEDEVAATAWAAELAAAESPRAQRGRAAVRAQPAPPKPSRADTPCRRGGGASPVAARAPTSQGRLAVMGSVRESNVWLRKPD